jgi:hypothetical protein
LSSTPLERLSAARRVLEDADAISVLERVVAVVT